MGGLGSGRTGYRAVVEQGLKLDSYRLQRQGVFNIFGCGLSCGSIVWSNAFTGEQTSSIGYEVNYSNQTILLNYFKTIDGEKRPVNDTVWLTTQKTNYGGSRFLFLCPRCDTRVAKLYLPNGALHFRCRRCYNLTYQSSNDSGKGNRLLQHIAAQAGVSLEDIKRVLKHKF